MHAPSPTYAKVHMPCESHPVDPPGRRDARERVREEAPHVPAAAMHELAVLVATVCKGRMKNTRSKFHSTIRTCRAGPPCSRVRRAHSNRESARLPRSDYGRGEPRDVRNAEHGHSVPSSSSPSSCTTPPILQGSSASRRCRCDAQGYQSHSRDQPSQCGRRGQSTCATWAITLCGCDAGSQEHAPGRPPLPYGTPAVTSISTRSVEANRPITRGCNCSANPPKWTCLAAAQLDGPHGVNASMPPPPRPRGGGVDRRRWRTASMTSVGLCLHRAAALHEEQKALVVGGFFPADPAGRRGGRDQNLGCASVPAGQAPPAWLQHGLCVSTYRAGPPCLTAAACELALMHGQGRPLLPGDGDVRDRGGDVPRRGRGTGVTAVETEAEERRAPGARGGPGGQQDF